MLMKGEDEKYIAGSFKILGACVILQNSDLVHPKTIVEGGLYLKGNWLLWSLAQAVQCPGDEGLKMQFNLF